MSSTKSIVGDGSISIKSAKFPELSPQEANKSLKARHSTLVVRQPNQLEDSVGENPLRKSSNAGNTQQLSVSPNSPKFGKGIASQSLVGSAAAPKEQSTAYTRRNSAASGL